jgi:rod shape-determining protein MreC
VTTAVRNRGQIAVTSFVLFCLSLFLTAYTSKNPTVGEEGAILLAELASPLERVNASAAGIIGGWKQEYLDLVEAKRENGRLRQRLGKLELRNSELMEFQSENERLRNLLQVKETHLLEGVAARVIGFDPSNWVRGITLNKGTDHGVQVGMPVIEGRGIVGQVTAAGPKTSKVILMIDHSSSVDALVQSSRARGIVEGSGSQKAILRYVVREEKVEVGDRVITSGMDGVYPKGMLLGKVVAVRNQTKGMFQQVEILPGVDFQQLEDVFVVTGRNEENEWVPERQ